MKMRQIDRSVLLGLVLFLAVCIVPGRATAQRRAIEGSFERTLNVSGVVDLDVSTGSGSIEVRPGSSGRVEIRGRIRAGGDWWRSDRNAEEAVRQLESNPPIE